MIGSTLLCVVGPLKDADLVTTERQPGSRLVRSDVTLVPPAPDAEWDVAGHAVTRGPVPAFVVAGIGGIDLLAEELMDRDVASVHGSFDHGRASGCV